MINLWHELRLGARALRASPSTTAAAVIVMALGLGANMAVFAATYGILMRPLPYRDVSRLVTLSFVTAQGDDFGLPLAEIDEWQRRLRTVDGLAGYRIAEMALRGVREPRLVPTASVTADFFEVLGVPPARGGLASFREAVDVAVVADRLAPATGEHLGRGVSVGDRAYTLAALMPRGFAFPSDSVEVWIPAATGESGSAGSVAADTRKFRIVARLAPGVTLEQLYDDAVRVVREIRGEYAATPGGTFPSLTPVADAVVGEVRPVLHAAAGAAVLVLLVTCSNVAMLLLGQAALRRRETAVRVALGAPWWHLVRRSLVESFLLAAVGSLVGLWLAAIALRVFLHAAADLVPRADAVAIDGPVLAAGVVMLLVVTLLCGGGPVLRTSRKDFAAAFRGGVAGEPRTRRILAVLVAGQIAGSIVLLSGALLLVKTVDRLLAQDIGVASSQTLVARLSRGTGAAPDPVRLEAFVSGLLQRVRALPNVEVAGVGSSLPPRGLPFQIYVRWMTEDREESSGLSIVSATPGFLEALGAGLVSGRLFASRDDRREDPAILLSASAARFYAPTEDLTGRELPIKLPPIASFSAPPRILGVVRDVKYAGLDLPAAAAVYLPWSARPAATSYLAVRVAGDADSIVPAVRRILRQADPQLPMPDFRSLADEMALSIADRRLRVVPALGFAAVALAVALTGVFATLARAAAERRRELAIRMALGATETRIAGLMMRRGTALTAAGVAVGLVVTMWVSSGLRSLLFGVTPTDPWTLAAVVLFVSAAALTAAYLPARRAAKLSPWDLLRAD